MKEHSLEVTKRDAGSRIDVWLSQKLNFSRNRVKHLLDNGKVLVNHRRVVIAGWELDEGDEVLVRIPREVAGAQDEVEATPQPKPKRHPRERQEPVREERVRRSALRNIGKPTLSYEKELEIARGAAGSSKKRGRGRGRDRKRKERGACADGGKDKRLKVYHHDKHIVVVEKEAGLLTVPQKGSDHPHVLGQVQAFLRRKFPKSRRSFVKPLHRLDNETSGLLVVAVSREGEKLEHQFRKHTISRRYVAAVHGAVEKEEGRIEAPLEKGDFGHGRKVRVAAEGAGKMARTDFQIKERYANASLVDINVSTGRTHQVRVHFASVGHPLIGDKVYADERHKDIAFPRHALHAHALGFRHRVTGKKMRFRSPLPDDMKKLIDDLRTG